MKTISNFWLFISLLPLFFSCYNRPSLDLENYKKQKDAPKLIIAISCLKDDGYKFGHGRFNWFKLPPLIKKTEGQDFYIIPYHKHEEIKGVKRFLSNHHPNKIQVKDTVLQKVKNITAVIVTKQFGAAIHYEHADIVFEQWEYNSSEVAELAMEEMLRLNKFSFGTKEAQFFIIENLVYYCDVYSFLKKAELKRVVEKVRIELNK